MNYTIFSYRFAKEIIEHPSHIDAFDEIVEVISECPLFVYPHKSTKNDRLDVVQQLLNTYYDRKFASELNWRYHPNATSIPDSKLAADFRKNFPGGLRIQAEVQFGNMSRWYTDIFKFQTAYSQDLIDLGLCIVPLYSIAKRIDSNITHFERCCRELPSAKLSITLPILLIGVDAGEETPIVNAAECEFATIKEITGQRKQSNRRRIVHGFLNDIAMGNIDSNSEEGPIPVPEVEGTDEE